MDILMDLGSTLNSPLFLLFISKISKKDEAFLVSSFSFS